jgi:ATP-dependent DNA helicase Rep
MAVIRLNPAQQQAVEHTNGPLLVLAGAGSGKTRVIVEKIAHLIERLHRQPEQIAAITFTNKAAREMQARVAKRLNKQTAKALNVCTFHALGLRMLRTDTEAMGYRRGFSIFDPQDSANVLRDLVPEGTDKEALDFLRNRISSFKNQALSPEQVMERHSGSDIAATVELYRQYQERLKQFNAVDFDDLILQPLSLLDSNSEARLGWRERLRYFLVDEYQDTNASQYRLLCQLAGSDGQFTAVGDDDQSIYGWRGAEPENIRQLGDDYPALRVVKLEQNYRSSRTILRLANGLIANNPHDYEKKLWSELGDGEPARIIACKGQDAEADKVIGEILHRRFATDCDYSDIAILYRSNHQSRAFEQRLRSHRVPYHLSGGTAFFERAEVKDVLCYLRLLSNPDDDSAFLRVINTPRREIGATTLAKLADIARQHHCSMSAAANRSDLDHRLDKRAAFKLRQFCDWLAALRRRGEQGEVMGVVESLVEDSGYRGWLKQQSKDPKSAERKLANIDDLVTWVERLHQQSEGQQTLAELLAQLALMTSMDKDDDEPGNAVRLMTLHAAKGLEFPYVFIVGAEEGLLPHQGALEEGAEEEERRLFYVGLTRAQRALCISYVRRRRRYGEDLECAPSRFLRELPSEDVRWEGREGGKDEERSKERADAHRESLRAMFNND